VNTFSRMIFIAVLAIALEGCAWRFGPGISMHDRACFMESPYIVQRGTNYFFHWRYGTRGPGYTFAFSPESRVRDGALVFSLQVTTSSGTRPGGVRETRIEGKGKIQALETKGAFWWETEGEKIPLKILKEMSNNPPAANPAIARHP
jgi:hypothetical protein